MVDVFFGSAEAFETESTVSIGMNALIPSFQVGASEAALLQMLNIKPFHYGLIISHVYDNGAVFSPEILDITDDDIIKKFSSVSY